MLWSCSLGFCSAVRNQGCLISIPCVILVVLSLAAVTFITMSHFMTCLYLRASLLTHESCVCVCVLQARSEYLILLLLLLLPQSDLSADAAANLVLAGGMQRQRQRQEGRAATRPPTASTIRSHQITSSLRALSHLFTNVLHLYARFYASRQGNACL